MTHARIKHKRRAADTLVRFLTVSLDRQHSLSLASVLYTFNRRIVAIQHAWHRYATMLRAQEETVVRQVLAYDRVYHQFHTRTLVAAPVRARPWQ